jgi:hypothetical protein
VRKKIPFLHTFYYRLDSRPINFFSGSFKDCIGRLGMFVSTFAYYFTGSGAEKETRYNLS